MKFLKTLLRNISDGFERFMNPRSLPADQEAYFAQASDHCELETRMRQLGHRQYPPVFSQ